MDFPQLIYALNVGFPEFFLRKKKKSWRSLDAHCAGYPARPLVCDSTQCPGAPTNFSAPEAARPLSRRALGEGSLFFLGKTQLRNAALPDREHCSGSI